MLRFILPATFLIFFCKVIPLYSQSTLEAMVNTEKAFAANAESAGVRNAFLIFLDTNCINFKHGQINNAYQDVLKDSNDGGKLRWFPQVAGIAASGDLGYTTGPFTGFDSLGVPAFSGHFTSIWKWKENKWKNIVDVGIGYPIVARPTEGKLVSIIGDKRYVETDSSAAKDISELAFIKNWEHAGAAAYDHVITEETRFNRQGHPPYTGDELKEVVKTIPASISFKPVGSGVSAAGDLLFVYGNTNIDGKNDNYLRIWMKRNGEWKLLLQFLAWK